MIHLLTILIGLSLFTLQILAEWLAGHHREAVKAYASFQRCENIYPKFTVAGPGTKKTGQSFHPDRPKHTLIP